MHGGGWVAWGCAQLVAALLAGCAAPAPAGRGEPAAASASPAGNAGASNAAVASAAAPTTALRGRDAYPAPDDPEVKLRVGWCAVTGAQFPLWLAKESGILAKHRLDTEVVFTLGADVNLAALQRGDLDFLECSGGATTPGLMAGIEAVFVGNFYPGNFFRMMALPEVGSVADLRGRRLGIGRAGDYDNRLAEVTLERHGLVPNLDVTMVPMGTQNDRVTALRAGQIAATTVNPPLNLQLANEGFREIYNLRELGVAGISVCLVASQETVRNRPRLVERFLAAMVETSALARADRDLTIQVMSDYMKVTDRQALEGAYDTYVSALAVPPRVSAEALQPVMDENMRFNATPQVREAARLIDNGPLDAVIASGFVDAVLAERRVP